MSLGRSIASSLRRNELLSGIRVYSEMYNACQYRVKAKCRVRNTRKGATFSARCVIRQVLRLVQGVL